MLYLKSEKDAGLLMLKNGEVFPTDQVAALDSTGARAMRWGFARFDGKGKVINAGKTALEKNMFRAPMLTQAGLPQTGRCLIPASAYFEWETRDKQKIKYKLRPRKKDSSPLRGFIVPRRDRTHAGVRDSHRACRGGDFVYSRSHAADLAAGAAGQVGCMTRLRPRSCWKKERKSSSLNLQVSEDRPHGKQRTNRDKK